MENVSIPKCYLICKEDIDTRYLSKQQKVAIDNPQKYFGEFEEFLNTKKKPCSQYTHVTYAYKDRTPRGVLIFDVNCVAKHFTKRERRKMLWEGDIIPYVGEKIGHE